MIEYQPGDIPPACQPYIPRVLWHSSQQMHRPEDYGVICKQHGLNPIMCRYLYPMILVGKSYDDILRHFDGDEELVKPYFDVLKKLDHIDLVEFWRINLLEFY